MAYPKNDGYPGGSNFSRNADESARHTQWNAKVKPSVVTVLGAVFMATVVGGLVLSGATSFQLLAQVAPQPAPGPSPQNASPSPAADAQVAKREAWRKAMARVPLPKNGCFDVSYPSTEWHEVPCLRPSPYTNPPEQGAGNRSTPNSARDASRDFSARMTGSIASAVASPNSVKDSTSAPGDVGEFPPPISNAFMPQPKANCFSAVLASVLGCQDCNFSRSR